jgi:hypothetical protein
MERYTVIDSATVIEVHAIFTNLIRQGFGNDIVVAYDPEDDAIVPITGFLYATASNVVEICTDE